jgi:hypothetical protein
VAGAQLVDRADNVDTMRGELLRQLVGLLQPRHSAADMPSGDLVQRGVGRSGVDDGWGDLLDEVAARARRSAPGAHRLDGARYRTAVLVAEYHDERHLQLGHGELDRTEYRTVQDVAGGADHADRASTLVEHRLHRHPRVEAAHHDRVGPKVMAGCGAAGP